MVKIYAAGHFGLALFLLGSLVANASVHRDDDFRFKDLARKSSGPRRIRGFAGGPSTTVAARALAINVSEHLKQARTALNPIVLFD
jgi:hypothetical protein